MKKRRWWLLALALPLAAVKFLSHYTFPAEAGSIGVIGGADGPTVIYTTDNASPPVLFAGPAALILFILFLIHKKS